MKPKLKTVKISEKGHDLIKEVCANTAEHQYEAVERVFEKEVKKQSKTK